MPIEVLWSSPASRRHILLCHLAYPDRGPARFHTQPALVELPGFEPDPFSAFGKVDAFDSPELERRLTCYIPVGGQLRGRNMLGPTLDTILSNLETYFNPNDGGLTKLKFHFTASLPAAPLSFPAA